MALNENMNEEQDMPVPQEPVQKQEEVTLPQPLTKEEEEKILAGEIPEVPEEVPTELVEEVAKGVEDALGAFDAQAQEPSMGVIYPPPGQEPGGIADAESAKRREEFQDALDAQAQEPSMQVKPLLYPPPGQEPEGFADAQAQEPVPQVQEPRLGPETIFFNDGFEVYYTTDKKDIDVDYDFSDPQNKTSVLFNRGYTDEMVDSQGYVKGSRFVVRELISLDRQIAEENGIDFSFSNAFLGSMADLYIDAMKRLGKDVSKLNPNSRRFQMYAASKEGAREIDQALTFIYYHDKFSGEIPNNIKNRLELPQGKGRLDSSFIGLTDREYEGMGTFGKAAYNFLVAGRTMADTAFFGLFEDSTGEVVSEVAPVGEIIGTFAGYMVPFAAAGKVMAAKNILQATRYGRIPGWAVRGAVQGIAADTVVFGSDEGTLGNVLAEFDSVLINNAFTTALAIDIDDPEWWAKTKIALEGVVLGGMLDATVSKLRQLKLGERIPGFFDKVKARLGKDGLPKTSGFNPELDKAILGLEDRARRLEQQVGKDQAAAQKMKDEGQPQERIEAKLEEAKIKWRESKRLSTLGRILRGEDTFEETGLSLNKVLKGDVEDAPVNRIDLHLFILETIQKINRQAEIPVDQAVAKLEAPKLISKIIDENPGILKGETPIADDWVNLSDAVDRLRASKETFEEAAKIKRDIESTFEDTVTNLVVLAKKREIPIDDAVELLQMASFLHKQDPSLKSEVRLVLAYDILDELTIPKGSRRRRLVPAEMGTNLRNLEALERWIMDSSTPDAARMKEGILSELELKEILANRARSNRLSPAGVLKYADQVNKHGVDAASKPVVARAAKGIVDILVDLRTNNILNSLGLLNLAAVGGGLVKSFRGLEYKVGDIAKKVGNRLGLKNYKKEKLVKTTKNRIAHLESREKPTSEELEELAGLRDQLAQLERTPKKIKEDIALLKQIEAEEARKLRFLDWTEADEKALVELRTQATNRGLVVEDPTIRLDAKHAWREERRLDEKLFQDIEKFKDSLNESIYEPWEEVEDWAPEEVILLESLRDGKLEELLDARNKARAEAKKKTALVPKENPTRISDLEEELKALKDPTYRRVDTRAATIDNIFYTLSGGKIRLAGAEPAPEDLLGLIKVLLSGSWDMVKGLASASAPSRIDPAIATKSEALLGAGLKAGYDDVLGIDPAGLSRLGKLAQGISDPAMRTLMTTLVSILEFIPRKGLATIDEGLKTREFVREFMIRIDENIKKMNFATVEAGVATKDQQEIADIIKEAMLGALGSRRDALDFVELIMSEVDALTVGGRFGPDGPVGTRGELLETQDLELEVLVLEQLSKLDMPEGPKNAINETLSKVEEWTKARRLTAEDNAEIRKVVERTVEEAQQFARETTITQDVPPMLEGLIKGMQRYAPLRGIEPFARAITNVGVMAFARVPGLNLLIRKERQALSGALGEIEQARSIGKLATGIGLGTIGWSLLDTDGDDEGIRLEVVDKGSWEEYNLVIPKSADEFAEEVEAGALRWYMNNTEIIDRELEREGLEITQANAIDYITSNLPEWEDREGSVKINFSRLGPFNTLIEMGMILRDAQEKTPWEYMTEKEEENSSYINIVTQTFDFISNQGYLGASDDFFKMFDNPDYAAEAFIKGWGADLISPGRGLFSTAAEPFQPDFRPSREEDMWTQKRFNQILAQDPNTLMKKRDFLGRVIDAPDRVAHLLGKKEDLDLITSEMEEMGFRKRVPRPTSVTKFSGIDLRKFKLKSTLTKEQKELLSTVVVAKDGQNAYEDFLIMSGSINVAANKYDETSGSTINGLQEYFKSQEYKTLKDTILSLEEGSSPDEKNEAEVAYDQIRKRVNKWISIGREQAALALYDMSDMYINEDGDSLREISDATYEGGKRAEFEVNKRLQGLDALRSGGNK